MTNYMNVIGDSYTKFGLKHTSKSTACLPHTIRFFKKHILTPKENSEISNASFIGGTLIHMIVQESLTKKLSLDNVIKSELIQSKIDSYEPNDEKDKKKFEFIIKAAKETAQNHLDNLDDLGQYEWSDEQERVLWTPPVNTYWLMYIDLIGKLAKAKDPEVLGDLKNKFGTVTLTKTKGWTYTNVKCPDRPFYSDVQQVSLYQKATGLKPFLSYASNCDRKLFTQDNCEDLKQENLDKALKELMIYEIAWEKKLELADGDLKTLAILCCPDFSDIKKKSFWYQGVSQEQINRLLKYYE